MHEMEIGFYKHASKQLTYIVNVQLVTSVQHCQCPEKKSNSRLPGQTTAYQ